MALISGGPGDDTLNGTSAGDLIDGGRGSDIIRGNGGDDTLYAGDLFLGPNLDFNATDELFGGAGNDILVGSVGTNIMVGGAGNDTLTSGGTIPGATGESDMTGVDPNSSTAGRGEEDVLVGGAFGVDVFRLGNAQRVFYNDGKRTTEGRNDQAKISRFDASEDRIVLKGNASQYQLQTLGAGVTEIYFVSGARRTQRELIATVEGSRFTLTDSAIEYV